MNRPTTSTSTRNHTGKPHVLAMMLTLFAFAAFCTEQAAAQSLNWEGQTGVFLTPLAAEVHEQESAIKNLPGVSLPNTLAYAVRIVPTGKAKLNVDFGVGQVAGQIAPGVNVTARHQFAFGISYGL
jgi:hypothetical protein